MFNEELKIDFLELTNFWLRRKKKKYKFFTEQIAKDH